ncbi:hypothetical protein HN695_06520 [Candidatus Woesearchaeota archaeon]|nr:hypothetical protein [Candidatus Woesearchaeota archaeon]MBT5272838.1 hypothetical protein [Candidatus Woesearchaeota archaeon]MBT6040450.1 hypothetical protein [Candidatus Woesearchaeota archaeon]MBT6336457.1 hypothetical protein [Candidatus Woesearchaeota archaeon]MBT7927961.1 hypothetical protein [Candidatus Woesearchaeota archaeon]
MNNISKKRGGTILDFPRSDRNPLTVEEISEYIDENSYGLNSVRANDTIHLIKNLFVYFKAQEYLGQNYTSYGENKLELHKVNTTALVNHVYRDVNQTELSHLVQKAVEETSTQFDFTKQREKFALYALKQVLKYVKES